MRSNKVRVLFTDWAVENIEEEGMTTDEMCARFSQISKYCPSPKSAGAWLRMDKRFYGIAKSYGNKKIWFTKSTNINSGGLIVNPSEEGFRGGASL